MVQNIREKKVSKIKRQHNIGKFKNIIWILFEHPKYIINFLRIIVKHPIVATCNSKGQRRRNPVAYPNH